MNIERLFSDERYLKKEIEFHTRKKQIKYIEENPNLVRSHLKKARHNLEFFSINKEHHKFRDWLIVTLYYALYHSALSLIKHKGYSSKNHYATILILIKEYSITKDEAKLIDELSVNKEDAQLYSSLKDDRHDASYSTDTKFDQDTIEDYEEKVIDFINKTQELIK